MVRPEARPRPGRLVDGLSLPDQQFHLVLHSQLELFQAHFFGLLVIGKVRFSGKRVELNRVTGVFLAETPILLVAGHQLLPDGLGRSAHGRVTSTSGRLHAG